nr:MAG TPA: hypothetical protein [Caudoviricetes sp.]
MGVYLGFQNLGFYLLVLFKVRINNFLDWEHKKW